MVRGELSNQVDRRWDTLKFRRNRIHLALQDAVAMRIKYEIARGHYWSSPVQLPLHSDFSRWRWHPLRNGHRPARSVCRDGARAWDRANPFRRTWFPTALSEPRLLTAQHF